MTDTLTPPWVEASVPENFGVSRIATIVMTRDMAYMLLCQDKHWHYSEIGVHIIAGLDDIGMGELRWLGNKLFNHISNTEYHQ